ncbi:Lipid-binding [Hyphodiscus hymeniophilus]|uniref:ATP synthase subunit 9, mitochondrial n=1 Tax=Hyphodiscus hymeniophilus TaxID=353542 RepID=A0A9P7AW01_9HELO|nr:Lipid-binding [Hyphodiscus hymeniophilus]
MAARMVAPKMASLMAQTSAKVARPVLRTNIKTQVSQRTFSGKLTRSRVSPLYDALHIFIYLINLVNWLSKSHIPHVPACLKPTNIILSGMTQTATRKASPFQAAKRTQVSQILKATQARQTRPYSSEIADAMVQVSQNMGMGSAAIGLGGAGIGIGMVFGALILAVARNPSMRGQLFSYAILGFAFVEAIGLFDLMVAMMCKYV